MNVTTEIDFELNLEKLIEQAKSLRDCIDGDGMETEMIAKMEGLELAISIMRRPYDSW